MNDKTAYGNSLLPGQKPGVARADRISDQGLQRLDRHLQAGVRVSNPVLAQWVKRYGEPALAVIKAHGRYSAGLQALIDQES